MMIDSTESMGNDIREAIKVEKIVIYRCSKEMFFIFHGLRRYSFEIYSYLRNFQKHCKGMAISR